ncbi:inverted formin-2-like [Scomber scombrus]|uniref:inverted formin-2-like n=1 Tax=Scomber scombrus TaxID=13677 RepID=UPI002DDA47C1|nr:inverted formin-2-like [Scomber scombrus]
MATKSNWEVVKGRMTVSPTDDPEASMNANLENAEPELCIRLLQVPTMLNYSGLRRRLESSDRSWMEQFLEQRGLDLLMEALQRLSGRGGGGCSCFSDTLLPLTCVCCIRAVMNSSTGLCFILNNQDHVRTLTQAVDTSNIMVKMQVFELLAALSVFHAQGRHLALDALNYYKSVKKQQYRFSVVMNELQGTDNVPYMVTLMSVVNVLVLGEEDLRKRSRLRQEFIGTINHCLDLLPRLRETEDENLNIQCYAFEDSLTKDEEEMERLYGGIDMSSHQHVFTSLFTKVPPPVPPPVAPPSPPPVPPPSSPPSAPPSPPPVPPPSAPPSPSPVPPPSPPPVPPPVAPPVPSPPPVPPPSAPPSPSPVPPPSPPPVPPPSPSPVPPPSPPPVPPPSSPPSAPPSPSPLHLYPHLHLYLHPELHLYLHPDLHLYLHLYLNPHLHLYLHLYLHHLHFATCTSTCNSSTCHLHLKQLSSSLQVSSSPSSAQLLSILQALLMNIFPLKQFKCSHEDFVSLIQRGDTSKFDVEILKQLKHLLPEKHEVENLKSHQANRDKLASVDQFYLQLLDVPSYSLRIECMLQCEESSSLFETLKPEAELLDRACQSVRESTRLPSFCKLILDVGNFLNYGSHTGNAEGFKISTLLKLTETKANKSRITLLHHILEEVEQNHPDLLNLPDDLEICESAAGVNSETIQSELSTLNKQLKNCEKKLSSAAADVQQHYLSSIQDSLASCEQLQQLLSSVDERRTELCVYLCEDSSRFSLYELFNTIKTFRGLFLRALKENESRRKQEEESRRKQEEKQRRGDIKTGESNSIIRKVVSLQDEDEGSIIDNLLAEIKKGYDLKKTRTRSQKVSLPPAGRTRDSRPHDHHVKIERSLAFDEPDQDQTPKDQNQDQTPKDQTPKDQNQDQTPKDQTQDQTPKDQTPKDQNRDQTPKDQNQTPKDQDQTPKDENQDQTPKDQDQTPKDQDQTPKDENQDQTPKDQDQTPKDQTPKDQNQDQTPKDQNQDQTPEDQDQTPRDQDQTPRDQDQDPEDQDQTSKDQDQTPKDQDPQSSFEEITWSAGPGPGSGSAPGSGPGPGSGPAPPGTSCYFTR